MSLEFDNDVVKQKNKQTEVPPERRNGPSGFSGNFGIKSRLLGMGNGGEALEKLHNKMLETVSTLNQQTDDSVEFDVIKLLKKRHGLNYSGLIVTQQEGDKVMAHVLMIEATGDTPDVLPYTFNGVKYNVVRTPSEALDDDYQAAAHNEIASVKKVELKDITIVDGTIIPREFDVNNESAIIDILDNSLNATNTEMSVATKGYEGFSIAKKDGSLRDGTFSIGLYFNNENIDHIDVTGLPVRQDFMVDLKFSKHSNNRSYSINQGNSEEDLIRVFGYIDFDYVGPNNINGMLDKKIFLPNLIITHIKPTGDYALTPDLLGLGITSLLAIAEDHNWLQAFRPSTGRVKKAEVDFRNIGALNIEGNIENNTTKGYGEYLETRSQKFTNGDLMNLSNTLIRQGVMVSIDVPRAGGETWFTNIFKYASGGYRSPVAIERLNTFLNTLTGGVFGVYRGEVFENLTNIVNGGYYQDEGGIRDLRHLESYLSFANWIHATKQQPDMLARYTNTLYNPAIPPVVRAAERAQFVHDMSNGTAVFKQTYERLTFSSAFLEYLSGALQSAGFSPVLANTGFSTDAFTSRSHANYGHALGGNGSFRVVNQGSNNSFINMGNFTRRW